MTISLPLPVFVLRGILALRTWLRGRDRQRCIASAQADARRDVDALDAAAVARSLLPGRSARGWDGAAHLAGVPELHRAHYSRAYYVASRDRALERLDNTG